MLFLALLCLGVFTSTARAANWYNFQRPQQWRNAAIGGSYIAYSPTQNLIAVDNGSYSIALLNSTDGSLVRAWVAHTGFISAVNFSPNGQTLATAAVDGTVKLWKVADASLLRTINQSDVDSLAFSPDGLKLATGDAWGNVDIWQVSNGSLYMTLAGVAMVGCVAYSPVSNVIAAGYTDGTVILWHGDGTQLRTLFANTNQVDSVAFSPDGQTLASAGYNDSTKLWQVSNGALLRPLPVSKARSVAFSPNGQTLSSADRQGCSIWRVSDGVLEDTVNAAYSVAWASSGTALALNAGSYGVIQWGVGLAYQVTPSAGAHGTIYPSTVQSVLSGQSATFTATSDYGYTADTWTLDGGVAQTGGGSYTLANMTANHAVNVTFKLLPTCTVTPTAGLNGAITPNTAQTVPQGTNLPFTATPATGFMVDTWSVDGTVAQTGGNAYTLANVTANHGVNVAFTTATFTVTAISNSQCTLTPSTPQTVTYNGSVTVSASPNLGYIIIAWLLDGIVVPTTNTTSYTLSNVTANHTMQVWCLQVPTVTITPTAGPNGAITPNSAQTITQGQGLQCTATPNSGFMVDTWYVDGHYRQWGGTSCSVDTYSNHTVQVTFKPLPSYTITPSCSGDGTIAPAIAQKVQQGGNLPLTASANTGSVIDTWYVDGQGVQTGGATYTVTNVTANHVVLVTFKKLSYLVTPSAGANGAISPNSAQTVTYDHNITFTATATAGCTVDIWSLDSAAIQTGGATYTLTNVTAAHAVAVTFKAIPTFIVTPTAGANGTINPNTAQTVTYGHSLTFTATADAGYTADTWELDGTGMQTGGAAYTLANITAAHTLNVTFKPLPTFTVTPTAGANGTIDPNTAQQVTYGNSVPFIAIPNTYYSVDTWTLDSTPVQTGGATYTLHNVMAAHAINVTFKPLPNYTITPCCSGDGTIAPASAQTVPQGGNLPLTAIANAGSTTDTWFLDGRGVQTGGATYTVSNVTANHVVLVTFKKLTYPVTPSAGANGAISPNTTQTVTYGNNITFTASANAGFTVDTWTLDSAGVQTGGATYTLNNVMAAHAVSVTFTAIPTFTVTPSAGAHGTIAPSAAQTVMIGNSVTFTATADAGYTTDTWSLDGTGVQTGGAAYTLANVTAAHTVNVTFKALPILTITVTAGNNGAIAPNTTQSVIYDNSVTFNATPNTFYMVDTWTLDGQPVLAGVTTYTLNNVTTNHAVNVTFKLQANIVTINPSAGAHGTISPNTPQMTTNGGLINFTAYPDAGYMVDTWYLDGVPKFGFGANLMVNGNSAEVEGLVGTHTVSVTFTPSIYTITPSSDSHGTISPNTPQLLHLGDKIVFTATANAGFTAAVWVLDNTPAQTGGATFELDNVSADHSVSVAFTPIPTHARNILQPMLWKNPGSGAQQYIAWSPTGTLLAQSQPDYSVQMLNPADGTLIRTLTGNTDLIWGLTFTPDGLTLAAGSNDTTINLWRVSDGALLKTLQATNPVNAVAISPDGLTLAAGISGGTIELWRISDGALLNTLTEGAGSNIYAVAFSPDGQTLAAGSDDYTTTLWRVNDGALLNTLTGQNDIVMSVAFSPDGLTLAAASFDKTIVLYRVSDGTLLKTLVGHADVVTSLAFSPDGKSLLSGSADQTIMLWNVSDGTLDDSTNASVNMVVSVAFAPNGNNLAACGMSGLSMWELGYQITPTAGANGAISPNTVQPVPSSGSVAFTATANAGFTADTWTLDGTAAQTGGGSYTVSNITANHAVNITFKTIIPTFTVTPSTDGNGFVTPNLPQTVNAGGSVTLFAAGNPNYFVDTWYLDGGKAQKGGGAYTLNNITTNHAVKVIFKSPSFTITPSTDGNGTISPNAAQEVTPGGTITFTVVENTGYTADTWSLDGQWAQIGGASFRLNNVQADHTVSVTFKLLTYTITPVADTNGTISPSVIQAVAYGGNVAFTATANAGFTAATWSVDGALAQTGGANFMLTNVTANHIVNLTFANATYTVTPTTDGNGVITPNTAQTVNYHGGLTFTATANAGFTADTWTLDGAAAQTGGGSYTVSNITANHAVNVTFKSMLPVFTVTPSTDGNGVVTPNLPQTVNAGGSVTIFAAANPNSFVDTWYLDGGKAQTGGGAYTLNNITANHAVNVTFKSPSFTVTPSTDGNGVISPNAAQQVTPGGTITFTVIENTGFTADTWSLDGQWAQTGGASFTLNNVQADHTVSVTFKLLTVTVTPVADANGAISPSVIQAVSYGDNVAFTATANANYTADTWSVDGTLAQTGGANFTLTNVTANHIVNLTFANATYTVTPSTDGNGAITPNTAQTVNYHGDLTFTAQENAGFTADTWTVDGTPAQTGGASFKLNNVQANHTVKITFSPLTYIVTPTAVGAGTITPNTAQTVNYGGSVTFTALENAGFTAHAWTVDGTPVQTSGASYTLTNVTANHTVNVTFTGLMLPDLTIKNSTDAAYLGQGIFNLDGAQQTKSQTTSNGMTAHYFFQVMNAGSTTDAFTLTCPAPAVGWKAQFVEWATGKDITAAITAGGWKTAALHPGVPTGYTIHVTPQSVVAGGTVCALTVTAISAIDRTQADAVQAVTTAALLSQPDLTIGNAGDAGYIGYRLFTLDGTKQTRNQTIATGATASYFILLENAGNTAETFTLTCPLPAITGWKVQVIDCSTGNDITAAVRGAGFSTITLNPCARAGFTIHVTPTTAASGGTVYPVLLTVTSSRDLTKQDAVKAVTTLASNTQPDLTIGNAGDAVYAGYRLFNLDGVNQTKSQTTVAAATVSYFILLENAGNTADIFVLNCQKPKQSGWNVQVIDCSTGNDITAAITTTGFTTKKLLNPFARTCFTFHVTPTAAATAGVYPVLVTVSSGQDSNKSDAVKAVTTKQ